MRCGHIIGKSAIVAALIILAALFLFPVYLVLINSVKSYQEVTTSLISFPVAIHFANFPKAWQMMNYGKAFLNSVGVTIASVSGVIFFASMASYQIVRRRCRLSSIIYYSILASMAIPFQVLMVPSVIVAKSLHIVNTTYGLVIMYWGFMLPMAMFLYQGFIKSVPRELEEAAMIDGCGQIYAFFKIVFPMLLPITSTIAIINVLGVFNDFLLPLIMLSSDDVKTIPLSLSIFFSNYTAEWNLIMAALALSIIPGLVFFLLMQKKIIGGLAEGAIKG